MKNLNAASILVTSLADQGFYLTTEISKGQSKPYIEVENEEVEDDGVLGGLETDIIIQVREQHSSVQLSGSERSG